MTRVEDLDVQFIRVIAQDSPMSRSRAVVRAPIGRMGLPDAPYPGSEGMMRSNATSDLAPKRDGKASGSMTIQNSKIEPGQPCVLSAK